MTTFNGSKTWKERPPGPEQLLLDEMFENGSITMMATPESVRQSSEVFKQFSSRVFAAHYRKTKARLGEFISQVHIRGLPGGVIPPSPPRDKKDNASGSGMIPELGGSKDARTSTKKMRLDFDKTETSGGVAEIINPPYSTWQYKDHALKTDFVCVAINSFTGSKSVSFDVAEDGFKIIVRFFWAAAIHSAEKMFNEEIANNTLTMDSPMLHAMASTFLNAGITGDSTPEVQWVIPLPCQVRREVSSYTITKLTYESTKIVFIKLTAYQNDVIIEQANRTISLD